MSTAIEGLLFGWKKNTEYAPKLVADLSHDQMTLQPVRAGAPANHPAWVFSHLNTYLPIICQLIRGQEFDDPKDAKFGMQSQPESDASLYAPKEELINSYLAGHAEVADLLAASDESVLERPVLLPRWKEVMPRAGIALPYLMLVHENTHLGQLSAWRRIQGMPSV